MEIVDRTHRVIVAVSYGSVVLELDWRNLGRQRNWSSTLDQSLAMITEKVLGAYAAIGTLPPTDQAAWYRRAAGEWGINAF